MLTSLLQQSVYLISYIIIMDILNCFNILSFFIYVTIRLNNYKMRVIL